MLLDIVFDREMTWLGTETDKVLHFAHIGARFRTTNCRPWFSNRAVRRRFGTSPTSCRSVMESFAEPLGLSSLEEFKWFCSARVGAERGFPPTDQVRYSRARRAFGSPRFYAAYRAWRRDPSAGFFDLSSIGLRDKLQCGLVRAETHMLTHR